MRKIERLLLLTVVSLTLLSCGNSQHKDAAASKSDTDSCCSKESKIEVDTSKATISDKSEITCPKCGHKKIETLPTDVCQLSYTCENCKTVLHPKEGDCCVFCTYGDHKCPSKQN